jgi:hypothetical protein
VCEDGLIHTQIYNKEQVGTKHRLAVKFTYARYLHGRITFRTPSVLFSFRKQCCFAVLELHFANSLKHKIHLSHSKQKAAALQTLLTEVIAVYSEN